MLTIHAAVLPFDRQRTVIADLVESSDDLLKVHGTAAQGTEVPRAARVAEVCVTSENAGFGWNRRGIGVLHVDVVDAVAELVDELHVVDVLVDEVGRIVVEAEFLPIADGIEGDRTTIKERRQSRNQCTTTTRRTLEFDEDGQALIGVYTESFRVEGPEACGDAPFGDRQRADLTGASGLVI